MTRARTAMAFGSFDVFHPGHLHYLKMASRYGRLIVVVARDINIKKLKGREPLIDEQSRLEMVSSLRFVHKAVLGERVARGWNDVYKVLLRYRPDVLVFGYDQRIDMLYLRQFLDRNRLHPRIVRLGPYKQQRYKSSKLKALI